MDVSVCFTVIKPVVIQSSTLISPVPFFLANPASFTRLVNLVSNLRNKVPT